MSSTPATRNALLVESARAYRDTDDPRAIERGHVRGRVVGYRCEIVVAVAGTNDVRDWLQNVRLRQVETRYGRFHEGFQKAASDILPEVATRIEAQAAKEGDPSPHIALTGHSAGGPIASIIALHLLHLGYPCRVVTFGAPRWCDAETAEVVEGRLDYTRCVYRYDLVPHVPIGGWLAGGFYAHPTVARWWNGDMRDGMPMLWRIAAWPLGAFRFLGEHGAETYKRIDWS